LAQRKIFVGTISIEKNSLYSTCDFSQLHHKKGDYTKMNNTFMLAVDGSSGSDRAVNFAIERAKKGDADVVVVYVIEWSPYSFNTPEENAERHKRREEEIAKALKGVVEPVAAKLKKEKLRCKTMVHHGHPAETLARLAEEHGAAQIFIGRRGETGLRSMLFGSVVANLVQTSPVPVTVVP
jgi:nucleotide-binding universal stress UspA family protein